MSKPIGRTALMVVPPDPGRKNAHLVMILHKGGGWYEAQCTSAAKRCRTGVCEHSRGLTWSDASRPIRQAPFVEAKR